MRKCQKNKSVTLPLLVAIAISIFSFAGSIALGKKEEQTISGSDSDKIMDLEKKLQTASGRDRVIVLNHLAGAYWRRSPEKVFEYAQEALKLAQEVDFPGGEGIACYCLGHYYQIRGEYDVAFEFHHRALELLEKASDKEGMFDALTALGRIQNEMGGVENVRPSQNQMGNYERALNYFQRAEELVEQVGTKRNKVILWLNMGFSYGSLKNYDLALEYFEKSLDYIEELEDKDLLAYCYGLTGWVYSMKEDHEKALEFHLETLKLHREVKNRVAEIRDLNTVGGTYLFIGDYEKAYPYLEEGLSLAKEMENKHDMMAFYVNLSEVFRQKKDYEKALEYHGLYADVKDEIINEGKNKEIADLQVKYETAQKEKEIEIKELALSKQRNIRNLVAAIAGLVLVLAGVTYNRYRFKAKTNKKLEAVNALLDKENEAKSQLFSIVAHDLRSFLGGFVFSSEYLKNHVATLERKKIKETVDDMFKYSIHLSDLLESLLEWAFSQLKKIKSYPQRFDLNTLVQKIVDLYSVNARQKEIRLYSEIEEETFIYGDKDMIKTAIGNLVSNGVKFTNAGGEVKIVSKPVRDKIQIQVADTGIGISKEKMDKLFVMDVSKKARGTADERGSGVGLVLAKEFIEKNQGRIWVESEENKGSHFYVELPQAKEKTNG